MTRNSRGFTLLELLIVIGIIGVLVALTTVSYSATQEAGRDSRRKQDMIAIQNALEQYYSSNNFKYPENDCTVIANTEVMKQSWPTDPDGEGLYVYTPYCSADGSEYCICARMERDNSGNARDTACAMGGDKKYYCVQELQ